MLNVKPIYLGGMKLCDHKKKTHGILRSLGLLHEELVNPTMSKLNLGNSVNLTKSTKLGEGKYVEVVN